MTEQTHLQVPSADTQWHKHACLHATDWRQLLDESGILLRFTLQACTGQHTVPGVDACSVISHRGVAGAAPKLLQICASAPRHSALSG